jgi:hypothetical protein
MIIVPRLPSFVFGAALLDLLLRVYTLVVNRPV